VAADSSTTQPLGNLPTVGSRIGDRYVVDALIGRGGMGAVFSGHDAFLERPVAIKLLGAAAADAGAQRRFLNEGKVLARVVHEACVRIFDTGVDGRWGPYLVMERLVGRDLAAFLTERGPLPTPLALSLADQLCGAVQAVHDAGIVHRDLKPGNVFVLEHPGEAPRVKLLDFGIAVLAQSQAAGAPVEPAKDGVGTLAYMAPERWSSRVEVTPAADVYALGAIVYEMLGGGAPFRADSRAGLRLAILNDPPRSLRVVRPELPPWLCSAVELALRKSPHERPASAAAFGGSLGFGKAPAHAPEGPEAAPSGGPRQAPGMETFVGRKEVLAALEQHVHGAANGPRVILIEGASGMGKSALLDEFRARLDREGMTLVLAGRAREGDSVPYPALGEVVEELAAYLTGLPAVAAEALLPTRCRPLARLFPVFARVPAIARTVASLTPDTSDVAQARRQAYSVLRELLSRLCKGRQVVVVIDDLQWIDSDGAALLAELMGGYDAPPLLLVAAVRMNDSDVPPPELQRLQVGLAHLVQRVPLGPLSHGEARALFRACAGGDAPVDLRTTARLCRQSGGVPFFVVSLAAGLARGEAAPARLETFLIERARKLSPPARAALDLLCLSSRPLPVPLVLETLGIGDVRVLDPLFTGSFVRWTRFHARWVIEPYHNKIRETMLSTLPAAAARRLHGDLARRLREDPLADPEVLVEHLAGSGDGAAAAEAALTAARVANQQLAFDRAAALLAVAAEHRRHRNDAERLEICRAQVRALQNAGRRREAGEVLLRGLAHVRDRELARELEIEAGGHLLLSGDLERGVDTLRPALALAGLRVPADFAEIVAAITAALNALGARGLAMTTPAAQGPSARALERVDLCLLLAQGLAHVDLRVVVFACHALHGALDAGEPVRVQRACALFVINTVEYVPNPLVAPVLQLCKALTAAHPHPLSTALLEAAVAENAHFEGDFLTAEAAFERAERVLLQACPGATRELATVRDLAVFIQYAQKGDFRTQVGRTMRWLAQAEASGDLFHASMLRVAHAIVWIARDNPAHARAELLRAQDGWEGDAGVLGVAAALYHDIIDRYEERDLTLTSPATPMRSALLRSPAAQTPFLGGYLVMQDVWAELRAIANGRRCPADIRARIGGLRKAGPGLWLPVADALEGNLDYLEGAPERAVRLMDRAEEAFRRLHMPCLAACARKRRGQLAGGEWGRRLEDESEAELSALGVVNAERWTRAYWSMFDVSAMTVRTQDGDSMAAEPTPPPFV